MPGLKTKVQVAELMGHALLRVPLRYPNPSFPQLSAHPSVQETVPAAAPLGCRAAAARQECND